ncbi:uncharacterized protein LOC134210013 [Armigeres subalbatus]|uniref:uncharacterized protein LOC134210013 n=1 Tax=Armigeres subalbatus TaxID=124917 RepID=UPI002ED33919
MASMDESNQLTLENLGFSPEIIDIITRHGVDTADFQAVLKFLTDFNLARLEEHGEEISVVFTYNMVPAEGEGSSGSNPAVKKEESLLDNSQDIDDNGNVSMKLDTTANINETLPEQPCTECTAEKPPGAELLQDPVASPIPTEDKPSSSSKNQISDLPSTSKSKNSVKTIILCLSLRFGTD